MKRLMILGAMEMHVPVIKRAKELGLYTITVDYIKNNPGHSIADEAHFESTTDLCAVYKLAMDTKIDGIMTYNSDPAAPTVAYVAEKMNLPGNSYESVKIMSEKDLFRNFLKEKELNVPNFYSISKYEDIEKEINKISFPIILKPVDSSGSKGCSVLYCSKDLKKATEYALEKSRCKRIIIEEYIEADGCQLHGDGFVKNGQLVFLYLGDHHFNSTLNNLVPVSTSFPTCHTQEEVSLCEKQITKFIADVGFKNGGFNVELRISKHNKKAYIIDIGARNGGNFTPKVIEFSTGFNFLDSAINIAIGNNFSLNTHFHNHGFFSYLIIHSKVAGIIKKITISKEINDRVIESHMYLSEGDKVEPFIGANTAIGVLILKYESRTVMDEIINNFNNLYTIEVE